MKRLALLALLVLATPASAAAPRLLATVDAWPVWSPDGRTIAFTRIHPGRNLMELEVLDLKTGRVTKLAQNSFQLQPSWSADGRSIAYQAGGDVYVAGLDGSKRKLGKGGAPAYGPTSVARVLNGDLVVDGVVWAEHVIGHPAWSPDGTRIAFRRDDGIFVAAGPGGDELLAGGSNPGDPAWSPDSSQLAFTIRDEVWVASGGLVPAHAIARKKPDPSTPSWSSDGTAVVYSWRGGVERTTLAGRSALLHRPAGSGVSSYGDGVAWIGPRRSCPGHLGVVVKTVLTGSCVIQGTARADVIEGTPLWGDVIQAGAGNDKIHANDGHTDRVNCGPGRDEVWADRTDKLTGCEIVHR